MKNFINSIKSKSERKGIGSRVLSLILSLSLVVGLLSGVVIFSDVKTSEAADGDISILIDGKAWGEDPAYQMGSKYVLLALDDESAARFDSTQYDVDWNVILGNDVINITTKSRTTCTVEALQYGKGCRIEVTVTRTGDANVYANAIIGIDVIFGIDTWGTGFSVINGERALAMDVNTTKNLSLNMGGSATWSTADTDVVSVDSSTGRVTAVGAGRTTITATGSGEGESANISVYVAPGVSDTADSGYSDQLTYSMDSGGYLYTNARFESQTPRLFNEKIYWEIQDMSGNILAATGNEEPTNGKVKVEYSYIAGARNRLKISGVAGTYYMYLWTTGTKTSFTDEQTPYQVARVNLTINSGIEDKNEVLGVGDQYSLAESFNLTEADFNTYFSAVLRLDTGASRAQDFNEDCADYATLDNHFVVTTKQEGQVVAIVTPRNNDAKAKIAELTNSNVSDYYLVRFNIVDTISLSQATVTMMVDQTYTLHVNTRYDGDVIWTTSNSNQVAVEDTTGVYNTITAKEVTTSQAGVTITASINIGNGVYRRATCRVTVTKKITNFKLDPSPKLTINIGRTETVYIISNGSENLTELPFIWQQSSGDEIISIEPRSGNSEARITGLKGGTTTLMVTNTDNYSVQRLEVEVIIPVDSLAFADDEYDFQFYNGGKNMRSYLNVTPSNATSSEIEWKTSNTKIATVDDEGYLTFLAPGVVTLTAKVKNDYLGIPVATCTVNIKGTPDNINFDGLTDDALSLEVGDIKTLNLSFEPATSETKLVWTVSKAGIVRLDYDADRKQLNVLGQGVGTAIVTCRTEDNMYYTFDVSVTEASSGITFAEKTITLVTGDDKRGTYQLTPQLTPTTSTDSVTYTSNNSSIASVNASTGLVTAVAAGTTYIIGTTSSGKSAIVDVIVRDLVTELGQSFQDGVVYVGETLTITPTVLPSTADNKNINWSWSALSGGGAVSLSSGIAVMTGTPYVEVTGVSTGVVKLLGVSAENKAATVMYVLTVQNRKPVYNTKVTLSPSVKYINVGKSFTVSKKVTGAYKGNKTLKWKSSKKSVATVTQKGKVTAKKVGTATITATAQDGSKKKDTMKVVVRRLVSGIKLNKSSASLLVGKSIKLSAKITPSNATVKGVTWKSSDPAIATVNGGKVIAQAPGMVKITATSKDVGKKKASCWVTVSENVPVTSFSVADESLVVAKGKSVQSGITTNPANATNSVKYWSDNKSVATVSSRGKITTKKAGQATIYARASNGVEAHVDVTVVDLNRKAVTLRQYDTEQLNVMGISTGITWYSANPQIASVSTGGLVTGRKAGTTTVYAVIDSVKLGCRVTVKKIT